MRTNPHATLSKIKLGKVAAVSLNIVQNHSPGRKEVISGHYFPTLQERLTKREVGYNFTLNYFLVHIWSQVMCKVDQR